MTRNPVTTLFLIDKCTMGWLCCGNIIQNLNNSLSSRGVIIRFIGQHYFRLMAVLWVFPLIGTCAAERHSIKSGIFIDAPVHGLMYQSGRILGRTDASGTFYYEEEGEVTFSIEGVVIGEPALGKDIMTPLDLISDADAFVTHPTVTNIGRFLQSLDEDGDPENGIALSENTRIEVAAAFSTIDFSEENFEDQVSEFFTGPYNLRSAKEAQAHLFSALATFKVLPVDLINLGDGFTTGMQSSQVGIPDVTQSESVNAHQRTQVNGYAQVLANHIRRVVFPDFDWNNPLLEMDNNRTKTLLVEEGVPEVPHNLGVPGATVRGLLEDTSSVPVTNEILDEILGPIGLSVTQLEAAKLMASQDGHENRMKLFTVWIGMNDLLGALTQNNGGSLTEDLISGFLNDAEAGHDLESVQSDLTLIVNELNEIQYSYIFIANLPDVTKIGSIFYKEDLESLAAFDSADVTALKSNTVAEESDLVAIGYRAFVDQIGPALDEDNTALNNAISGLPDEMTLSKAEADLIKTRVEEINAHIIQLIIERNTSGNVFLVDFNGLFEELAPTGIFLPNQLGVVKREFGGGFYSTDGIYPSHTGYVLLARKFIERINDPFSVEPDIESKVDPPIDGIGIYVDPLDIDETLENRWDADPYRDHDGDGFHEGPGIITLGVEVTSSTTLLIVDPSLEVLLDCDDDDGEVTGLPRVISGIACEDR